MGYLIIVAIIVLVLLLLKNNVEIKTNKGEHLKYTIDKFGSPTDSHQGYAIWKESSLSGTVFSEIVVEDSYVTVTVPYQLLNNVLIDGVSYSNKQLKAKSNSWENCVVLLQIATSIGNGKYSLSYVKENDLINKSLNGGANPTQTYINLKHNLEFQPGNPN